MEFIKTDFNGDSNVGLYGFATDSYCLLGFKPSNIEKIKAIIGVKVICAPIAESRLNGIFAAGNKNGIIVPKITESYEIKHLKKELGLNVEVINSKETALGNLVLCNDKGCLISNLLVKYKNQIRDALGVDVESGTVGKTEIVGSAAKATNKGFLAHREATEEELEKIENILGVKGDIGTVSFGTPFIKAGVIVNSKGLIVSGKSTGPEIDRCFEVFE